MATQMDIANTVGLDVSTVNKILHRKPGSSFRQETIDLVFQAARTLGYRVEGLKHPHRRADQRRKVCILCDITFYVTGGRIFDKGTALATELSRHGARLERLRLPKRAFPLEPFAVGIRPRGLDMEIPGRPVRLRSEGEFSLGIALLPMDPESQSRLMTFVGRGK